MTAKRNTVPFKKHVLKKRQIEPYTPPPPKSEGNSVRDKGYHPGAHYTDEELQFISAVERWKRRHRTKFLASIAFLRIAKELGYRRPAPTPPPPTATPVNATQILQQMIRAGFTFSRMPDGSITFRPPPDVYGDPAKERLFAALAWGWSWLAAHIDESILTTSETTR